MEEHKEKKSDFLSAQKPPNMNSWSVRWYSHPLLFSLYIPLFLFVHNFGEVYGSEIFMPLALFLLTGSIVLIVQKIIFRSWKKAALQSSLALLFLFCYGWIINENNKWLASFFTSHKSISFVLLALVLLCAFILVYRAKKNCSSIVVAFRASKSKLKRFFIAGIVLILIYLYLVFTSRIHTFHFFPLFIWLILALVVSFMVEIGVKNYKEINKWLNVVSLVIVLLTVGQLTYLVLSSDTTVVREEALLADSSTGGFALPDVYYIIPDEYAGQESLQTMFDFDNEEFVSWLRSNDFYVFDHSFSNYDHTHLSLPSTLNMDYIGELIVEDDNQNIDAALHELTEDNAVVKLLKKKGYTYIHIGSRWFVSKENKNADISYSYEGLSEFNELLVESTVLRAVNRNAQVFDYETLKKVPGIKKSPKFVFAHIPAPHAPFYYDKEGSLLPAEEWFKYENYPGQLQFVNTQLKEVVSAIKEDAERPVVILIQSDHGFRFCDKLSLPEETCNEVHKKNNFIAVYFSDGDYSDLYETMTNVNSFRIILNKYLETNFSLLPDNVDFEALEVAGD